MGGGQKLTNPNRKKVLLTISLSLFSIAIISLGAYALWNAGNDLLTGSNTIQSGQVKMSYTETNELALNNALPIKDEEGKKLNDYFDFTVSSWIKTNANDSKERKLNYNIVIEMISMYINGMEIQEGNDYYVPGKLISDYMYKVYLTTLDDNGNETEVTGPMTIEELNNYIIKSQEETFSNGKKEVVTKYRLRIWVDFNYDVDMLKDFGGFTINSVGYKFRVNVNTNKVEQQEIIPILNIPLGKDKTIKVTHEIDNTLQVDNKFATEYRYTGKNPNNYVKFNNELWRIIGVIPTEDTSGKVENRLKIIRNTSIGNMYWNSCEYTVNTDIYTCNDSGKYLNDWTGATLNTYLNTTYYNTLSTDAKNMIGTTKYYLGGDKRTGITSDVMWQYERKNEANRTGYYYGTNPIMQNDANKKIALMYASDYGYAASSICKSVVTDITEYKSSYCTSTNWLYSGSTEWLLSQLSDNSYDAFSVSSSGYVNHGNYVGFENAVRPVLYLSSKVKISSGKGTSELPYQLTVE